MKSNTNGAVKLLSEISNARDKTVAPVQQPVREHQNQQQQRIDDCKIKLMQQMHPHGGSL